MAETKRGRTSPASVLDRTNTDPLQLSRLALHRYRSEDLKAVAETVARQRRIEHPTKPSSKARRTLA